MASVITNANMISPAAIRVGARLQGLINHATPLVQRPVMIGGGKTGMTQKMFDISWKVKDYKGFSSSGPVLFGIDLEPCTAGHEQGIKRTEQVSEALSRPLESVKDAAIENLGSILDFPEDDLTSEPRIFRLFWSGNYSGDKEGDVHELFGGRYDCVAGFSEGPTMDFVRKNYMEIPYMANKLGESFYRLLMSKYNPRKNSELPALSGFSMFPLGDDGSIRLGLSLDASVGDFDPERTSKLIKQYIIYALGRDFGGLTGRPDCRLSSAIKGFDILFDCLIGSAKR